MTVTVQNEIREIVVEGPLNTVVVENIVAEVVVAPEGLQGPPGGAYTHSQATPSTTWTVNHNLGYRPAVTALTVGGAEMEVEIVHASANQAVLYLLIAMAGTAICS